MYRDFVRVFFDEFCYLWGGYVELWKYDNFGDRGDFIGIVLYESLFFRDVLGDSFIRKYDGDYRVLIGEFGYLSYYVGVYDFYVLFKDFKGCGRDCDGGYRDRDWGWDWDWYRDRDDVWDCEWWFFDFFSSDCKNGSGGGYDCSRRDDVIFIKWKSRFFDVLYFGDVFDCNSFLVGNEFFVKELFFKDFFFEINWFF